MLADTMPSSPEGNSRVRHVLKPDEPRIAETATYITFVLAGQTFAADVSDVREILDLQVIAALPNAPSDVLGIFDLRGEGIAVVDIGARLGLRTADAQPGCRIIVLDLRFDEGSAIGIIAEAVRDVVELSPDRIDPVPRVPGDWQAPSLSGVARLNGALVYVLNLRQVLDVSGPGATSGIPGPFDFA